MDIYADLLSELGFIIEVPQKDLHCHEYDDWNDQDWARAAELGTVQDFKTDYTMEQEREWRKKHRYCRRGRFKWTLYQLLNCRGKVPRKVLRYVKERISSKVSKKNLWGNIRKILKEKKLKTYYNQIPAFIHYMYGIKPQVNSKQIMKIIIDFEKMHHQFDNGLAKEWKRKYFFNMRYVCVNLFKKHGVVFDYFIPRLLTCRRRQILDEKYKEFVL